MSDLAERDITNPGRGVAAWDFDLFVQRYPEFGMVPDETLRRMWVDAEIFLDNTPSSQVRNVKMRQQLLFMLVAHLCKLQGWPFPGNVMMPGQLSNVSQGSVSLGMTALFQGGTGFAQWLAQTQYGAAYYAAIGAYKMARFHRGQQPYLCVGPRYFPYSSRWW